jgi:hypothetical protein
MKICPNDSNHKHFETGAVVCQDWIVDGDGNFVECLDECTQVFHKPNTENDWVCVLCGSVGVDSK